MNRRQFFKQITGAAIGVAVAPLVIKEAKAEPTIRPIKLNTAQLDIYNQLELQYKMAIAQLVKDIERTMFGPSVYKTIPYESLR